MTKNAKKELGEKGEELAAKHLQSKGYEIIHKNYRSGRAEIDIIAQIGNDTVFVEVKTRNTHYFGNPEEFVSTNKEQLYFAAADEYCSKNEIEHGIRFDIISVVIEKNNTEITHFEDAFWPMA
ncbi:MAG: YraN family protein [Flavobacteriales bacterium]|nr:YraN family protein [Flavobacteriales bacterium]